MSQQVLPGVMTANDLTARLLIEIPRRFPGARCWRRNVGRGIGLDTVKRATGLIAAHRLADAVELLHHRPVTFGQPGEPDIDGIVPPNGTRLGIEVKAGSDQLSEKQENFGAMIQAAGGIWILARSLEQALLELEQEIQRRKVNAADADRS